MTFRFGVLRARHVFLAGLLALTACDTPPSAGTAPDITFLHLEPLSMRVRAIEVVRAYRSPGQPPHVDYRLSQPPTDVAARWARDRLRPAGGSRQLRYIIKQASLVEVPLDISEGLRGALKVEQSERYEAKVRVEIEIVTETGRVEANAFAEAEHTITVPEDISLSERERTWFRLTDETMRNLDRRLEQTIRRHLGPYVLN